MKGSNKSQIVNEDIITLTTPVKRRKLGNFEVCTVEISAGASLKGLKFVQLTDLHYGPATDKKLIGEAVEISNSLNPRAVFITGDFIQLSHVGLRHLLATQFSPKLVDWKNFRRNVRAGAVQLFETLAKLNCDVFAVPGNHDHYEGLPTLIRQSSENIIWLINDSIKLSEEMTISGLDDTKKGKPDLEKTLRSAHELEARFRILLTHNPDFTLSFKKTDTEIFNLILCGHTHGGQIRLPLLPPPITRTKQKTYVEGLKKYGQGYVYVSRGVGYGTIPIRTFCRPEITVFEFI